MPWIITSVVILLLYCILIGFYHFSWTRIPELTLNNFEARTNVTVVIVGRNESERLEACLTSIANNDYPQNMYEIIYVDDHSEDDSIEKLKSLSIKNLKVLNLADHLKGKMVNAYKKEGIRFAISKAKGELILQTDADTIVPSRWISQHVNNHQSRAIYFATAPVFILKHPGFLSHFQFYDFMSTMGVTGAGIESGMHYMANGANMSYSKKWVEKVQSELNQNYASGDDMFMIHLAAGMNDEKVKFLKSPETAVGTYPEKSWRGFFNQRFRWAGKTKSYVDRKIQVVAALVFLTNLTMLLTLFLCLADPLYIWLLFGFFMIKSMTDLSFLFRIGMYYHLTLSYWYLFLSLLFYPIYYVIVGIRALVPTDYYWKERRVR